MLNLNQSRLKLWLRCKRAHWYKFVRNLERKVKGRPLTFGSLIHDCLEMMNNQKSYEPVLKKYEKQIKGVFEEERVELGLDTVVPAARVILPLYEKHWEDDGLKYLGVEQEIEADLIPGVTFKGTVDGIVQEKSKDVFLFERKTAKNIPDDNFRMSDLQTVVYFDMLPQTGFKRKLDGVIWDYIRSKAPTIPEPLKAGGLSKRDIDTLPEVYLAELKRLKIDPKSYAEFMDGLESKRSKFFRRIKLPISTHLRKEIMADFKTTAAEIRDQGDRKERTLNNWECPRCEFFSLCQADLRGQDSEFIIKHDYKPREDKYEKNREAD